MHPLPAIISPDTRRVQRLPPNQVETRKWPALHWGDVPTCDPTTWDLTVFPVPFVDAVATFTWPEFLALPRVQMFADMHCVTGESKLGNLWEGVSTAELRERVAVAPESKFAMIHCEHGFTTNLPLADFFDDDAIFALRHNGEDLAPEHGYPVRLVIPKLYAWKSAKWVRGIEFMADDRPGFWESPEHGAYHMRGDPWTESRLRSGQT